MSYITRNLGPPAAEDEPWKAKAGLYADPNPIPPWEWCMQKRGYRIPPFLRYAVGAKETPGGNRGRKGLDGAGARGYNTEQAISL